MRKDQNIIHLNDKFSLKIAKISLEKKIFLRNEIPKFYILSMHVDGRCEIQLEYNAILQVNHPGDTHVIEAILIHVRCGSN